MRGLDDLPAPMRRYLVAIMVAGPLAAIAGAALGTTAVDGRLLAAAAVLWAFAVLADRFPLHLTHKTSINVSTTAYVAMILVLPAGLPGLLALLATGAGQLSQLRRRRDPVEAAFNTAQTALYVTVGSAAHAWASSLPGFGPGLDHLGSLGALLVMVATLHVGNTVVVGVAAALHLGRNPVRVWLVTFVADLWGHIALSALGVVAALLAVDHPWILPSLAVPAWLVHRAVGDLVRVQTDSRAALAALVEVVELRDPYTAGHSRRVAARARELALHLGLSAEEADLIETAGHVHDIGKVAIDPAVLMKAGRLTEEEWAEMRRHPGLGADVVANFTAYARVVPLVRHHHERLDGEGYPDGLAGGAIPLGARVLAVADTFDALTSARPYRQAMPLSRAVAILREGSGSQWDPAVVDALLTCLTVEPAGDVEPSVDADARPVAA